MYEKALYLYGITGSGKTEMTKAILSEKFGKRGVLRVTNWDGLKKYDSVRHKAIILDDLSMEGREIEEKISAVDIKNGGDIRVLYETIGLKPEVVRAIITNKEVSEYFRIRG